MVDPCIAAACCELCAAAIAELAISVHFVVARWFSQASVTRRIELTIASIPIQKWRRNDAARNTGIHGASKIAAIAGLLVAIRMESKSRITWPAAAESVAMT